MTGRPSDRWGAPIELWALLINGHLPAYPPEAAITGTKACNNDNDCHQGYDFDGNGTADYGEEECISSQCLPKGFRAENDERFNTDPYAETAMRLTNFMATGAGLYGIVEGVTRAKGSASLARQLGYEDLSEVVRFGSTPTTNPGGNMHDVANSAAHGSSLSFMCTGRFGGMLLIFIPCRNQRGKSSPINFAKLRGLQCLPSIVPHGANSDVHQCACMGKRRFRKGASCAVLRMSSGQ